MKRILLVDDDEDLLELYRETLQEEGFSVDTATNGREAVEKVKEKEYDLVVLDIRMPEMDGIEALGYILGERKDIKVVLNTAYASYKDNFLTWGADAYILKSSDLSELVAAIKKLLCL
ncbi:response regulator [bacterium]|nr:MAG: response regulator [bacterium]RKZ24213.1 MAG: response regulator [bacterium]